MNYFNIFKQLIFYKMIDSSFFNIIFILFNTIFFLINIFIYNKSLKCKKSKKIENNLNPLLINKHYSNEDNVSSTEQKCIKYEKLHEFDFKFKPSPIINKSNEDIQAIKDTIIQTEQNLNQNHLENKNSQILISKDIDTHESTEKNFLNKQKNIKLNMYINLCAICDKDYHMNFKCNLIKSLRPDVLLKILYEKNLCKICFRGGHLPNICPFSDILKCKICYKAHNTKLHLTNFHNGSQNNFLLNSIDKKVNTLIVTDENCSSIMPFKKNDLNETDENCSEMLPVKNDLIKNKEVSKKIQHDLVESDKENSEIMPTNISDHVENKINFNKTDKTQNNITENYFEYDSDESLESFEDDLNLKFYNNDSESSNELDID